MVIGSSGTHRAAATGAPHAVQAHSVGKVERNPVTQRLPKRSEYCRRAWRLEVRQGRLHQAQYNDEPVAESLADGGRRSLAAKRDPAALLSSDLLGRPPEQPPHWLKNTLSPLR